MVSLMLLVTGCTTRPATVVIPPSSTAMPSEFPQQYYRQLAAQGKAVLHINPDQSLISIEVRRAGSLARLGHDHVVASHEVHGYVAPDEQRTDLYLPLATLTVDEPALRAEAGFDTQPTAEAIEGTRHNMLTKVLDAERYPYVLIHATRIAPSSPTLRVSIKLHDVTRNFEVPVQIEQEADHLRVTGRIAFNQSDFGIVPYSVLGGAIQVQDRMDLRFRIVANQR
jgi:hypothetical protein